MPTQPNILILLADQLRFDALSCNGAPVCRTPAMDAVAAAGVRFTNAFTPIALCTPARASLLTGRYPHNHLQLSNMGNFNGVFDDRLIGQPTLLSRLAGAGYRVGYTGKWHLPREGDDAQWGVHRWHAPGEWSGPLAEQGYDFARDEVQRLEWGGSAPFAGRNTLPAEQTQEAWTADRAIEMVEAFSGQDAPFLVTASFFGPHFPYSVPAPWDTRYDPADVPRPANFDERFAGKPLIQQKELLRWNAAHLTWPDWQRVIAAYWGYCSFVDHQMGRVLEALERSGRRDDTIVVVTADHGDMLGSHRLFNKGFHMYEETHRIPLLISGPGVDCGAATEAFANLVDLAPTLLELAEAEPLANADGRSLALLLAGSTPADWPDDVFAEFHGYETTLYSTRMIRTADWKYVYNPATEDELYDLRSDPGELHNLASMVAYGHVLRRMKARLVARMRATGDSLASENAWQANSYDLFLSGREHSEDEFRTSLERINRTFAPTLKRLAE